MFVVRWQMGRKDNIGAVQGAEYKTSREAERRYRRLRDDMLTLWCSIEQIKLGKEIRLAHWDKKNGAWRKTVAEGQQ